MPRVNPRDNPAMKRVIAPAPTVIVKPPPIIPPQVKTGKRPTREPYNPRPNPPQNRNVTQPSKKSTDWCGCEFWDVGCKAGCLAKERITDPIESGTKWIGEGFEQQVTIPFIEAGEWWTQGATDAVGSTQVFFDDAWTATADFFGTATDETITTLSDLGEDLGENLGNLGQDLSDATESSIEAINVFLGNAGDAWNSTGEFLQDSVGGTADWAGSMMAQGSQMMAGVSGIAGNMMRSMGNMMRGLGNLGNFASQPTNWIKYILIGIAILVAGFLAWRML